MNLLDPQVVATRIRQAGAYPRSRKALAREVSAKPEQWIPALIDYAAKDIVPAGTIVESLLSCFAAEHPDFETRFWLYQEIARSSARFLRLQAELAFWIVQQLNPGHSPNHPILAELNLELSQHLVDGGQFEVAPSFSREAVHLYAKLSKADRGFTAALAQAWVVHAQQLATADRIREAARANRSAIHAARRLVGARQRRIVGQAYVALGSIDRARLPPVKALSLLQKGYRLLKSRHGDEGEPDALEVHAALEIAEVSLEAGRAKYSQPFAEKAHRGFGHLVARSPSVYLKNYLRATKAASRASMVLGQTERSRALRYEGIELLAGLADRNPKVFLGSLLAHVTGLIPSLLEDQQLDEAECHVRHAIRLGRKWRLMLKHDVARFGLAGSRSTANAGAQSDQTITDLMKTDLTLAGQASNRPMDAAQVVFLVSSYGQLASICMKMGRMEEGLRAALRARFYLRELPGTFLDKDTVPRLEGLVRDFRRRIAATRRNPINPKQT